MAGLVGLVSAVLPATAFAQATTISPAQGAVLTAPSGITFSWTLPSDETAADLWYSDIDDIGPPFPGVAPPFGDVEVPLAPDQTSYVLTSRLARGVVYYWEISDYCVPDTTCAFNNGDVFPTVSDQSSFGVTNPLTYPMALEDLKLAILQLNGEPVQEGRVSCHSRPQSGGATPTYGCSVQNVQAYANISGTNVIGVASGSGTVTASANDNTRLRFRLRISAGCPDLTGNTCYRNETWTDYADQICDSSLGSPEGGWASGPPISSPDGSEFLYRSDFCVRSPNMHTPIDEFS